MTNSVQTSVLSDQKEYDKDQEKLWQDFRIDFHLEALRFPDNKIYGTINIIPESARKLIKKLVFVANEKSRVEFSPEYEHVSASGFNTDNHNPSAYIEAIPINDRWAHQVKRSNICRFYFTGSIFALSPTINFAWPKDEADDKPMLEVKWHHIGDKLAHRYTLYLDDEEIRHIRQKQIDDVLNISIRGFECGQKHTFQLAAKLNNGKETYRSDLIEFIVPDKRSKMDKESEFISVFEEIPPPNLPVVVPSNENETEEKVSANHATLLTQPQSESNERKQNTCCTHSPHKTFPGIEHYLGNAAKKKSFDK